MLNTFVKIRDLDDQIKLRHINMTRKGERVDSGRNIQTLLDHKRLSKIMKEYSYSFKTDDDVKAYGKATEEFTIIDCEFNELTLAPTPIGYTVV